MKKEKKNIAVLVLGNPIMLMLLFAIFIPVIGTVWFVWHVVKYIFTEKVLLDISFIGWISFTIFMGYIIQLVYYDVNMEGVFLSIAGILVWMRWVYCLFYKDG